MKAGAWTMTIAGLAGCSASGALSPPLGSGASASLSGPPAPALLEPVPLSELSVTSGVVQAQGATGLALRSPTVRAVVRGPTRDDVEIAFTYRGPSHDDAPLASGEMRRQIGVKLRARDTCNLVYVMWHIEPTSGIRVSVKWNPGQTRHDQCGDHGYINVAPSSWRRDLPPIAVGEKRTLRARIDGKTMHVIVDGAPAWEGSLPAEAFSLDGPVGLRSDNGEFDVELDAEAAHVP